MTQEELDKIIENHQHWLNKDCDGWASMRADLRDENMAHLNLNGANLSRAHLGDANLSNANLSYANFIDANLSHVNLINAKLYGANLCLANLINANLYGANLSRAYFSGALLDGVNLSGANLSGANLNGAFLYGANLKGAKIDSTTKINFPISCPSHGEFIGWKKVENKIIKLKIPEDAKRCSATTAKCRCDKALVLEIQEIDGTTSGLTEIMNSNYVETTYRVGEMVYPDSFDENRWNECSHGIHFFIDREKAVWY